MYNHYRHIVPAEPRETPVSPIGATEQELVVSAAPAPASKIREIASNVFAALPFVVSLVMIAGFGLTVYPLLVHGLPGLLAPGSLA